MSLEMQLGPEPVMNTNPTRLSYKFQRLRERVREAIVSGELSGKLPGERALAKRFKVNAKTLSKALTDLAAEGLLDRSIGLGTFVKGSKPADNQTKILFFADPELVNLFPNFSIQLSKQFESSTLISNDKLPGIAELSSVRFAVIFGNTLPDEALRDLIVRGKTVINVQRTVGNISSHAIRVDTHAQIIHLARHFAIKGHRSFWLNLETIDHELLLAVHKAIDPIVGSSEVHLYKPDSMANIISAAGVVICENHQLAHSLIETCEKDFIRVPSQVKIASAGLHTGHTHVTGQYASFLDIFEHIQYLIQHSPLPRPVTIWLSGRVHEGHTIATHSKHSHS